MSLTKETHKLRLLFTPSWLSLATGLCMSAVFVIIACLSLAQHNGRLGGSSINGIILAGGVENVSNSLRTFFSDIKLSKLLFIVFWLLVGFIAYNIVFLFQNSVNESIGFFHQLHYVHAKTKLLRWQLIVRILLLLLALILWLVFSLLFAWILLPATLNMINRSINNGQSPLYVLLSLFIFLLSTHIAVILLRFSLLRARVSSNIG